MDKPGDRNDKPHRRAPGWSHPLPPADSETMARLVTKLFKNAYTSSPIYRATFSGSPEDLAALAPFDAAYHPPKAGEEEGRFTVTLPSDFPQQTLIEMRLGPRS